VRRRFCRLSSPGPTKGTTRCRRRHVIIYDIIADFPGTWVLSLEIITVAITSRSIHYKCPKPKRPQRCLVCRTGAIVHVFATAQCRHLRTINTSLVWRRRLATVQINEAQRPVVVESLHIRTILLHKSLWGLHAPHPFAGGNSNSGIRTT
jgi:hypothetical protein